MFHALTALMYIKPVHTRGKACGSGAGSSLSADPHSVWNHSMDAQTSSRFPGTKTESKDGERGCRNTANGDSW